MPSYTPHHVHLMSHDAMRAGEFYRTMFGASLVRSRGANGLPRCNMTLGGQTILISTVTPDVTRRGRGPHSCLGLDHIGLGVDDMQAAVRELKARGAEFLMEPRGADGRIAFVKAPDGVSVELVSTARQEFAPQGDGGGGRR